MRVRILGSAAGGGFPQWNCSCPNCRSLRIGSFSGKARTQTQLAVSGNGDFWFLLGASPDLRQQIESAPDLQSRASRENSTQSPIVGVVLANADLDHVLGLLLLRELQPLRIHATASVRRILTEDNSIFGMLQRGANQTIWTDITPEETFPLVNSAGEDSGLRCRTLPLAARYPAYVSAQRKSELTPHEASVELILESESGKRLAFLPAVPQIDDGLLAELDSVNVLLFDGTFWSDDELTRIRGGGSTALQMGHLPVSSEKGSLRRLAHLSCPRKIYIHINNTNPMLNEASPEYRQVRAAGWEIAEDEWQFDL